MGLFLLGLGLVFAFEGLALALAPSRIRDLLDKIAQLSAGQRRAIGLAGLAVGVLLVRLAFLAGV